MPNKIRSHRTAPSKRNSPLSCSFLLVSLITFTAAFPTSAGAASILYTDSTDFTIFGTSTRDDYIFLEPTTFTTIGELSTFDATLGTLTGVQVYASLVGNYAIQSHCNALLCNFTTEGSFSDSFDGTPPGAEFSGNGYSMPVRLTQVGGCDFTRTVCSKTSSGNTHFSQQVEIDQAYFDSYLSTTADSVSFTTKGDAFPEARILHTSPFNGSSVVFESCIDNCPDSLALLSLAGWIAKENHKIYNDSHYKFWGRRFFQVSYTYEPNDSGTPVPEPPAVLILLFGLILFKYSSVIRSRQSGLK